MAQDYSGTAGQDPVGYDYQPGWYPTQEQQQYRPQEAYAGQPYYDPSPYAPTDHQASPPYGEAPAFEPTPMFEPTPAFEPEPVVTPDIPAAAAALPAQGRRAARAAAKEGKGARTGKDGKSGKDGRSGKASEPSGASSGPAGSPVDRARSFLAGALSGEHAPGKRALMIRTGAGVAALGVLIAAALTVTGDQEDEATAAGPAAAAPKTFNVAHTKTWTAQPVAAPPAGADDTLLGSWITADTLVRADSTGVHAYALADGKPAWTVTPPADGAVPCGLSPSVNSEGLGAALFRPAADPKSPCSLLAAVDTRTGKNVWTKPVSDAKENYTAHASVLADRIVVVGEDRAAAWAAADGKDLWAYAGQGQYCSLSGTAAGSRVLLHSTCADSNPADQAVALNAADGKVHWWRGLNNQPKTVTVLSAEPAVLLTTGATPADDRIFAWGDSGDPAAEIPVTTDAGRLEATRGALSPTPSVFFQDQTLATTLVPPNGGQPVAVAYDLTTGKQRWHTPVTEKGKTAPIGLADGALLLATDERLDQPAHLSRYLLTNGRATAGGGFAQGTGSLLTSGRLLTGGGKVVAVPEHSTNFGLATAFQAKG
ncbi:PQQ-binding-like beta-propeller repeat protein [Kitasatospora sp. NPDC096147]|uniref:outer membrane protein assembly factor BamB family protein n=1 Tax=Kitasatospora sp. NPDC096147 TaxID=3364093 RepID=UPI0037F48B15